MSDFLKEDFQDLVILAQYTGCPMSRLSSSLLILYCQRLSKFFPTFSEFKPYGVRKREGLCPMSGQCRQANVIYGATVKTLDILGEAVEDSAETYTGISYPVWKIRMYRHHTTFNNPAYRSETALADYIWDLQCPDRCYERGEDECEHSIDFEITWKILARAPGYNPITGMCRLCLKESFFILFHPETASLNKRTEIYQGCKHKQFKFLADCKVT